MSQRFIVLAAAILIAAPVAILSAVRQTATFRREQSTGQEGSGSLHASIIRQGYVHGVLCLMSWKRR